MIKQASQDQAIPSERSHSATSGFFGLRVHPRISSTLLRLHHLHSGPMLLPSALSCRRTNGRSTLRCALSHHTSRTHRVRLPDLRLMLLDAMHDFILRRRVGHLIIPIDDIDHTLQRILTLATDRPAYAQTCPYPDRSCRKHRYVVLIVPCTSLR